MNVAGRTPDIRYAQSGGLNIAFSVTGDGPDLVVAPGFISHLDIMFEEPSIFHFYSRLASFRRVVIFDKRGTGLSDPTMHAPTLEESVDDLRAVMDAAGCKRADILGISEGGAMAMLMTASHPDRVNALVLYGTFSRLLQAPDYPLGVTEEQLSALVDMSAKGWGEGVGLGAWAPSRRDDTGLRQWWRGCSASLPAQAWSATSLRSIRSWTSATSCLRSRRPRSCSTGATTGW
jgi:pimeloyl-ACP methyl ester carboxylesterase